MSISRTTCTISKFISNINNDHFYKTTPSCFNINPAEPKQIQCLPEGFQSILPRETEETHLWTIRNSIFDNCSPTEGADAGCGKNLQCNYYKNGNHKRWTCEPAWKRERLNRVGFKSYYQLSTWHQTCGPSHFSEYLDMECDQNTHKGKLICLPVSAYVKGVIGTKSICVKPAEAHLLQKRSVSVFCYSGCPAYGGAAKFL